MSRALQSHFSLGLQCCVTDSATDGLGLWATKKKCSPAVAAILSSVLRWGDVAQLVEHPAVTPLTQVRFPGAERGFFSQSQLSVQTLLRVSVHPRVQSLSLIHI